MNRTRLSITTGALAGLLTLAACSSSGGSSTSSNPPASTPAGVSSAAADATGAAKITIKNFGFSGTLTVKPGEKVTVVNDDSVAHTLTDKKTKKFDTGNIAASGGTGTFTAPTAPGKYPFGCTYHPEMAGTLTVTG